MVRNSQFVRYWAKVDKDDVNRYHLFHFHCLDVVAVADVWLDMSQVILNQLARQAGLTNAETRRIALFYVALHDLGKLDARFQSFVKSVRLTLQGDAFDVEPEPYNHGDYGYYHFSNEFGICELMKNVAGHHGSCNEFIEPFPPDADQELIDQDKQARKDWVSFCLDWFGLSEIPLGLSSMELLAGLCSVSDWIGSSITNFSTDPEIIIEAYYEDAKKRARIALLETGMLPSVGVHGFNDLFVGYTPRGIQTVLSKLPLKSGLTIVESDTGSGKTEFALAYASELVFAGLADGIVFGLPTQATANGLFSRIGHAANKLFPGADITLAHGKKKYVIPDSNGFLHHSNKRAFLGAISVATVDQILIGTLPVKHNFVRSFGVRKSVLILDEVHSFDEYMSGLVTQILKGQHAVFGSVIFLSATLPIDRRDRFLSVYGGATFDTSYPIVSWSGVDGTTKTFTIEIENEKTKSKFVYSDVWCSEALLPNDSQLQTLANWARDGAMVCVICNTVADAQLIYDGLNEIKQGFVLDLFHARYTTYDRRTREDEVLANYGKKAKREGRILVATQVVEQSLDLDFDVMVSQLAPIEFIMQRMGRLWRHERDGSTELEQRCSVFDAPRFITLCPDLSTESNLSFIFKSTGFVYKNIKALYRTQKMLEGANMLTFPACYRDSIEYVHGQAILATEPKALKELADQFDNECKASFYTAIKISTQYARPVNDTDPRAALLTREGEMAVSVVVIKPDGDLIHGGVMENPADRDLSTVQLSRKIAKGKWVDEYYAFIACIGVDLQYDELGARKIN